MERPTDRPSRRGSVVKRVLSMTAAWLLLGALLGAGIGVRLEAGPLGYVAHAVAGMLVCLFPGVFLGLFFARAKESLLGGLFGFVMGILVLAAGGTAAPAETIDLCAVIGGLVGATCWPSVQLLTQTAAFLARGARRIFGAAPAATP